MNYVDHYDKYHVISAYWHGMGRLRKALLLLLHPKIYANVRSVAQVCDEADLELFGHTRWQEVKPWK